MLPVVGSSGLSLAGAGVLLTLAPGDVTSIFVRSGLQAEDSLVCLCVSLSQI